MLLDRRFRTMMSQPEVRIDAAVFIVFPYDNF